MRIDMGHLVPPGFSFRRALETVLLSWTWILLLAGQLILPATTLIASTVLNPVLDPVIIDDRDLQNSLASHDSIALNAGAPFPGGPRNTDLASHSHFKPSHPGLS